MLVSYEEPAGCRSDHRKEGKILRHSRQKEELPLSAADLFPDEKADLREEILELVEDPGTWLDTPHPRLGWRKA